MSNEQLKQWNNKSFVLGLFVLTIGIAWLLDRLDLLHFPWWIFRWPMILIFIGIVIGIRKNFNGGGWMILILIGLFFQLTELRLLDRHLWHYAPAVFIIVIGLLLIFRAFIPKAGARRNQYRAEGLNTEGGVFSAAAKGSGEDYIDAVSVFGNNKRKIFSKQFKGGESTNFFGGTSIDLTQADIEGTVVIDVVAVFGGVKLIVPSNWEVQSNITAIFGGAEDKRKSAEGTLSSDKKLVITGLCIFGGVDVKSY